MGMVHAMQKGERVKGASPELKKVAKSMGKKDVQDFAKTKHKGLPKKVSESEFKQQLRSLMEADGHQVTDAVLEAGWQDFKKNIGKKLGAATMAGAIGLGAMGGDAQAKGNPYDSPEQHAARMQQKQELSNRLSHQVAVHGKETKDLGNGFYAVNINSTNGKIPAVYDAQSHKWIIKNPGTFTLNGQKPAFIKLTYFDDSGMFKQDAISNVGPETTKALQQAGMLESLGESEFKKKFQSLLEADGHQVTDAVLEAGWQDYLNKGIGAAKKYGAAAALGGALALGGAGHAQAQSQPSNYTKDEIVQILSGEKTQQQVDAERARKASGSQSMSGTLQGVTGSQIENHPNYQKYYKQYLRNPNSENSHMIAKTMATNMVKRDMLAAKQ